MTGAAVLPPRPPRSDRARRPLRALVVGAGHRVRNAFLPALACVDRRIEIVGIHSRSPARAHQAGQPWGIEPIAELRSLRPGDVDLVLVSVTTSSNVAVLRAIAHLAPGAWLVMDTPGIDRISDVRHMSLYRRWAQVRVAEDFMNMAQYRLVGRLIQSGAIGAVRGIRLTHMGYRYHALALVRSWIGLQAPRSARGRRATQGAVDVRYHFAGGVNGEIVEPYRQAQGSFVITGTAGELIGHPMAAPVDRNGRGNTTTTKRGILTRVEGEDGLTGFEVLGLDEPSTTTVPNLARLRTMAVEDRGEFNLLRIDGLCKVISSLWTADPVNAHYRIEDAMSDLLVSAAARRYGWIGVPTRANRNLVDVVDTALGRLRPDQHDK